MSAGELRHESVLLDEVLSFVPNRAEGFLLDVTAGGGGHLFAILNERGPAWRGEGWDRDPAAEARLAARARAEGREILYRRQTFGTAPEADFAPRDYILADIGVSSFQLDDPTRGMSLFSEQPPDFRMDPESGFAFPSWLRQTSEFDLMRIFADYGEEPRAKKLASEMKKWGPDAFVSAKELAERIRQTLAYRTPSRTHPATRAFQALRIAINDELGELQRFLAWAPKRLTPGGRLAVISFHSLEDRIVKNAFRALAATGEFDILTKKPLVPSEAEEERNPRARSAKLRVLERRANRENEGRP